MSYSIISSLVFRIPLILLFTKILEAGIGSLGYADLIITVFASLIGGYFYFSGKLEKDKLKSKDSSLSCKVQII